MSNGIRSILATIALVADRSVPLEAIYFKSCENILGCPGLFARWVYILDAQQPTAIPCASFKEARHGGNK